MLNHQFFSLETWESKLGERVGHLEVFHIEVVAEGEKGKDSKGHHGKRGEES